MKGGRKSSSDLFMFHTRFTIFISQFNQLGKPDSLRIWGFFLVDFWLNSWLNQFIFLKSTRPHLYTQSGLHF